MHRWVVLLVLIGCDEPNETLAAPPRSLYPAAPSAWPLGAVRGHIGRSIAPQLAASRAIGGDAGSEANKPLVAPTTWSVPGDGPARAMLSGSVDGKPAVELVDVDAGRVMWRDTIACTAPVIAVTAELVVCGDAHGTRALGLDGKLRWHVDVATVAVTDDEFVTADAQIRYLATGATRAAVELPAGFEIDNVIATCDGDVFAARDGKLSRIGPASGRPPHVPVWTTQVGDVAAIDACAGPIVEVTIASAAGTALLALFADSGEVVGRVDGVRGFWPARGDASRLEVATATGVARYGRELGASQPLPLPPLAELVAQRGDLKLVRATPLTALLLDREGIRAYIPLAGRDAVLGDDSILAGARRIAIPPPWRGPLRIPAPHTPVAVPAELRDLPQALPLDASNAIVLGDAARFGIGAIAIDQFVPAVYATTLEHAADPTGHAGIARFDAATRKWQWHRGDGCPQGAPIALAASRMLVVCVARTTGSASVRATGRDGAAMWEWSAPDIDGIAAAADVVLVRAADRLVVLDAVTGKPLGTLASDDGAAVRAAALDLSGMAMVVTYEQGRVVARLPRVAMVPAWSLAVAGVVRAIEPAGAGVVVALEDGDAVRIDAHSGAPVALAGLDLAWHGAPDVITGEAPGGPIPPARIVPPRLPPEVYHAVDLALAPAFATPWPVPPPMPASWELTLYELAGGVRVRNDYPLQPPITPAARAWGAPVVVASGPLGRDLLVIDLVTGDPLRRVALPGSGAAFSTIVDGQAVVGTILAAPLRAVLF